MRKKACIILAVLLVLAAAIGILVDQYVGWENVGAAIDGLRYSKDELEGQLEQNEQKIKDAVEALPDVTVRDITQEEKDALRDGTLTPEELVEQILNPEQGQSKPETPGTGTVVQPETVEPAQPDQSSTQPKEEPVTPAEPEKSDYEKRLSALIAEVYVLREDFLIRLEQMLGEAKAVYKALPAEERTKAKMVPLVADYMARGTALEEECDAKLIEILVQIEALVEENNGDPKLAETILETYTEEKRIKKAWYMAELKEKGLV